MPAHRADHALGAVAASRAAKHTRRMIARELRDRHKPDPLAPVVPACIISGQCRRGHHTGEAGCMSKPQQMPCWCGEPYGHDWPGKDERAPHPR
jgi:hypothetical protein